MKASHIACGRKIKNRNDEKNNEKKDRERGGSKGENLCHVFLFTDLVQHVLFVVDRPYEVTE